MSLQDKLEKAKEKLEKTPVNKGTEKARGKLKARIAQLKEQIETSQKETGGGYQGYSVQKKGDATVALVGYPSVGKSTLLNQLTNAESEVGEYQFTTLDVVPGMMKHNGANIQIVDVPGLIGGAAKDKGGGKQVISVIRNTDMVVLMADPGRLDGFDKMEQELYNAGIRLDSQPPNIKIVKRGKGGLEIKTTLQLTKTDEETVREIMEDWGYVNAAITIREDVGIDRVIDALARNRIYIPSLKLINKAETLTDEEKNALKNQYPDAVFISAQEQTNLSHLKDKIFQKLRLIRIYLKQKGKKADMEEPLIMRQGCTIEDVCKELHKEFYQNFKNARVWGESAKFPGQRLGLEHELVDEDVVEIST